MGDGSGVAASGQGATMRTGGQILADCLVAHGVDAVFSVPGESFLSVLDALYDLRDTVRMVVGRHEAGVANMAEAHAKLTGRPGICFVTRGPGATQAAVALHTAWQDSTPLILFVGQVERGQRGREAFQEVDYRDFFGRTVKWVAEVSDPARLVETINRAFHVAVNGRPGPVVISIPEDMQTDLIEQPMAPAPFRAAVAAPSPAALSRLQAMVEAAERPVLVLGGGGWDAGATAAIQCFAERFALPVAVGPRRQDLFDNSHPHYVGTSGVGRNPALKAYMQEADLLVVLGDRLGDTTTSGYTLLAMPRPLQQLIHIHPGPEELGALYETDLAICATMRDSAAALAGLVPQKAPRRAEWIARGNGIQCAFRTPSGQTAQAVDLPALISGLTRLPPDTIITNGAGNYTGNIHRYHQFRQYGTQVAPTSGAMGYGLPAALAAKVARPDSTVICFAGDGCFLMASPEFATAFQHDLPIIVVLVDNGSYGSIRMHQEQHHPGRTYATDLQNPDFIAFARSFGAHAEEVLRTGDFDAALDRAISSGRPALLLIRQDMQATVDATLGSRA